jgi:hypothetical protein
MARVLLLASAAAAALVAASPNTGITVDNLPFLHVRPVDLNANPNSTRKFVISDAWGREVMLRGACVEDEERNLPGNYTQRSQSPVDYADGACPENRNTYQEPPICEVDFGKGKYNQSSSDLSQNDFAQIRALGFNLIRLCVSWSVIEPTPGVYSTDAIDRIVQLVDWASEQDVYVIVDYHEDDYTTFLYPNASDKGYPPYLVPSGGAGNDGAPAWAVETYGWPPWAVLGIGNLNLGMMRAFQSFWDNAVVPGVPQGQAPGPGLADHFVGAMAAVAARLVNRSAVAGYEIINEPQPGITLDPFTFATDCLYRLYSKTIQALTGTRDGLPTCSPNATFAANCSYPDLGIHTKQIFFFEPSAVRNLLDFSPQISSVFTNYSNLVFTPHTYTHVFTIDRILLPYGINISWWPPSFEFAYQTAHDEANAMNAAVFVTEFGTGVDDDPNTLVHTLDAQDTYMTGATLWSWKSNCYTTTPGGCDWAWTVYFPAYGNQTGPIPPNGALDAEREWLLSRTQVRGAVGEMIATGFNRTTRSFFAFLNLTASGWEGLAPSSSPPSSSSTGAAAFRTVSAAEYSPSLPTALSANGTLTEVYIPPSVPFSIAVTGTAALQSVVTWPDGSRTAYVAPSGPGLYAVLVFNSTGGTTSLSPPEILVAAAAAGEEADPTPRLLDLLTADQRSRREAAQEQTANLREALAERASLGGGGRLGAAAVASLKDGGGCGPGDAPISAAACVLDTYVAWLATDVAEIAGKAGYPLTV